MTGPVEPIAAIMKATAAEATFGRKEEALDALVEALGQMPDDPSLLQGIYRLAKACDAGRAIVAWEKVTVIRPENAEVFSILADFYGGHGRTEDAINAYKKALAIDPVLRPACRNLAQLLKDNNRLDLAIAVYRYAVTQFPDDARAHFKLGQALRIKCQWIEAAKELEISIALDGASLDVRVEMLMVRMYTCDWRGLAQEREDVLAKARGSDLAVPPFLLLSIPLLTREDHLSAARRWARHHRNSIASWPVFAPRRIGCLPRKLKVGYVSCDFHNHATATLIVELLEKHDRERFEIFAYSYGPQDDGPMRRRIICAFDMFRDLGGVPSLDIARLVNRDEIDILIDLKGYTHDCRPEIFASRPAPIQVNYLGYPGTMGADFIDYIITDPIVAPFDHSASYDEKLVHLPNCYQPNDRQRRAAPRKFTREECGLPEEAFVFCCFNHQYKITEQMFGLWMGLLRDLPSSVLWLFTSADGAVGNLRREAALRGVSPERLVFASHISHSLHLARLPLADLFLDTLPYNSHTTASDALWAGVPLLTCAGETFAGRVAASLLDAVGLPELAAASTAEYRTKALHLARNPKELGGLRSKLELNRSVAPLFDSGLYARSFESALIQMAQMNSAGMRPSAFAVCAVR